MSTTNKKSLASQALLEMDAIKAAIKEESKSTIKTMLSEAVKDALRDSIDDDEYEVVDEEKEEAKKGTNKKSVKEDGEEVEDPNAAAAAPADGAPQPEAPEAETPADGAEAGVDAEAGAEDGGDWSQFDQYKVGEDTYDLTGEEDYDKVVKVYKLLNGGDEVVIKKDAGKIQLKDNEAGTEYVIDLGEDMEDEAVPEVGAEQAADTQVDGGEEMAAEEGEETLNEGLFEIDIEDDMDEDEFEGLEEEDDDIAGLSSSLNENKRNTKKTMKESKEVIFEVDLGYTDNYQDKDPIAGLSNDEPSKSGKSWHKGVPTGTEKPWAGKTSGKGDPFDKQINEEEEDVFESLEEPVEEAAMSTSSQSVAKTTHTKTSAPRAEHKREVAKLVHDAQGYVNENKELKKAVKELRKSLKEAYLVNVNLGKITKLFLENTTTQEEKVNIINRFNDEAKSVEQSKALYESINKQLKSAPKAEQMIENNGKASAAKPLNEGKTYGQTKDVLEVIDFMNRMKNC